MTVCCPPEYGLSRVSVGLFEGVRDGAEDATLGRCDDHFEKYTGQPFM
jgi:hypothetical protein